MEAAYLFAVIFTNIIVTDITTTYYFVKIYGSDAGFHTQKLGSIFF